jgi:hypothetical protein
MPPFLALGRERVAWKRVALLAAAAVLAILGVAGWLVPVVTGIPFYVAALVCAGMASDRVAGRINAAERRLPRRWRLFLRRLVRKHAPDDSDHSRRRAVVKDAA